jgi:Prolipoprotein diacylglyceryl transferase
MMINTIPIVRFNSYLDRVANPEINVCQQRHPAFQVCGYAGLVLAVLLAIMLIIYQQLSLWVIMGIIATAVANFLSLAMITKIVLGEERLIYYHHEIAIVVVVTLVLWLLHQPILPYLDVTIIGIGTFLAFGRIGCLMVGCCHGRPHRFGVCYREEHAHAGFTSYYVGVRLFPIQVVESLWVAGIVMAGVAIILQHYPAGTALAWYIISYDIGRFFFEFMRGDPSRLYWRGFSEGQWTSVMLMLVVVWLELFGALPYEPWHVVATGSLVIIMVAIGVMRVFQKSAKYRLLNPRHVREIAQAVQLAPLWDARPVPNRENPVPEDILIQKTSLGIQISETQLTEGPARTQHYALSCQNGGMTDEIAKTVAGVIFTIKRNFSSRELLKGRNGVYHLLLRRDSDKSGTIPRDFGWI